MKVTFYVLQPRANRFARKNSQGGQSSIYSPAPEYDDPANYAPEEDQYRRCNPYGQSGGGSLYCGPEYDDPANCAPEEDQYVSSFLMFLANKKIKLNMNIFRVLIMEDMEHRTAIITTLAADAVLAQSKILN